MLIECLKFESNYFKPPESSLIGFADLYLPEIGMEIHGCFVFEKDDRKWINLPKNHYLDEDKKKVYYSFLRFSDREAANNFNKAALEAIELFESKKPKKSFLEAYNEVMFRENDAAISQFQA